MCEDNNSKVISKDVDPNKIKLKDERFNDRLFLLGTEGAASLQDGRKAGGVVNGSVKIVKKAETGLMYMSDSRPSEMPRSDVFAESGKVEGYATCCLCVLELP